MYLRSPSKLIRPQALKVIKRAAAFVRYTGDGLAIRSYRGSHYGGLAEGFIRLRGVRCYQIAIKFPTLWDIAHTSNPLKMAQDLFETAAHEICHAQDKIERRYFGQHVGVTWRHRPVEVSVFNRLTDLTGNYDIDFSSHRWADSVRIGKLTENAILDLGIILEEYEG